VIRALGGWMSDIFGGRAVMYWVLGISVLISFMLVIPKMDIYSPGRGIMANKAGVVTEVSSDVISVNGKTYSVKVKPEPLKNFDDQMLILPGKQTWQEPVVEVGQSVLKKELLAKGVTRIFFQANVWIFAGLILLLGSIWGIGKAAVYKLIPDYFPEEVGVVGGMVGVLGGLGGFFCPIVFGYLLEYTGLWTSCWMFMFILSLVCLLWLHLTAQKMMREKHPEDMQRIEEDKATLFEDDCKEAAHVD
jgi:NNP family nitrate/nitrite transporter-like MFS transporter